MSRPRAAGSTSNTCYVLIRNKASTPVGQGLTGLAFGTAGLKISYTRDDAAAVPITLVTQTETGAWASGGFVEVDSVNAPGMYRLDVPDAAFVAGVPSLRLNWTGANSIDDGDEISLTAYDPLAAPSTTTIDAIKAKTDNLPGAPAAVSNIPTAIQIADALLARNQKGGANGPSGQTVADALASGFLKFSIVSGVLTIENGDGTAAYTRNLTRAQMDAIIAAV